MDNHTVIMLLSACAGLSYIVGFYRGWRFGCDRVESVLRDLRSEERLNGRP
jgi:hypothetical protein